jgi:hypothetical protein
MVYGAIQQRVAPDARSVAAFNGRAAAPVSVDVSG